jgi:hypothetical protein
MSERRFTLVPITPENTDALLADLTDEARKRDPMTGRIPDDAVIAEWDRFYQVNGGWSGMFLDEGGQVLIFLGAVRLDSGMGFSAGLLTRRLANDRKLLAQSLREWRKRLGPGHWMTVAFKGSPEAEKLLRHAGFSRMDFQPDARYIMLETEV